MSSALREPTIWITIASIAAGIFLLISWFRRSYGPLQLQSNGSVRVPLVEACSSIKGLPMLVVSENSTSPKLVLHKNHLEYRIYTSRKYFYTEVEKVDIDTGIMLAEIRVIFRNSWWAFSGNVGCKNKLAAVLRILEKKCPLSEKARHFLQQYASDHDINPLNSST